MNTPMITSLTIEFILIICLAVIVISLMLQVFLLKKKLVLFMKGASGESFEDIVKETLQKVKELEIFAEKSTEKTKKLEDNEKVLLGTPELLRYKALEGASSNQSFSLAFLNSFGDGVVLTTLHVRDRVSFYAKKITNFSSEVELSDEEKRVITNVKQKVKIK